jgi:hypothetical protein
MNNHEKLMLVDRELRIRFEERQKEILRRMSDEELLEERRKILSEINNIEY